MTAPLIAAGAGLFNQADREYERAEAHMRKYDPVRAGFKSFANTPELVSARDAAVDSLYYNGGMGVNRSGTVDRYVGQLAANIVHTATSVGATEVPVSVLWRAGAEHYRHEAKRRMTREAGLLVNELDLLYGTLGFRGKRKLGKLVQAQEFSPAGTNLRPEVGILSDGARVDDYFEEQVARSARVVVNEDLPGPDTFVEGLRMTRGLSAEAAAVHGLRALPGRLAYEGHLINEVRSAIAEEFPDFGNIPASNE